jgi:hypothetical protein
MSRLVRRGAGANDGGILGQSLESASPARPTRSSVSTRHRNLTPDKAEDTNRNNPGKVKVKDDSNAYHYIVPAHHLIPGEASLAKSQLYKSI